MAFNRSPSISGLFATAAFLVMLVPRLAQAQANLPDVQMLCLPLEITSGVPQEAPCLRNRFKSVAKRDGSVLTLRLNNGQLKVMSDAKACEGPPEVQDQCVTYRLVGNIADQHFLVDVGVWESSRELLVSRRTGAETELEDWPRLSPGKRRFVVVHSSEAETVKNAVAIYSLASDPPKLEWSFPSPEEYELYLFDGWDGDNRVRLHVLTSGLKETDTEVKLTAKGWQLKRPNGELILGAPAAPTPRTATAPTASSPASPPPLPPAPPPTSSWPPPLAKPWPEPVR
jgi:hypothetical protein